ncbi:MAG: ankyrin repeat domain-containing protein [Rivularia sp. (in: Bacteria)]|nr:ankyrin repeat domain-containing protein [Rivularia sp. MS3]
MVGLDYKKYWKELIFLGILIVLLLTVDSEDSLFLVIGFALISNFILSETRDQYKAIHTAVSRGDINAVRNELERGEDVDSQKNQGLTPLELAASDGYPDIVELLISRGANVNHNLEDKEKDEETPIFWAATSHHFDIVDILIAHGATVEIQIAAFLGDTDKIGNYLEQGGDINAKRYNGKTLLHMAAWNNQLKTVELLIINGADVNIKDNYDRTPLHFAAYVAEAAAIINTLIENGAAINLIGRGGTPLHIAAHHNHNNIAKQLIERGANLEAEYRRGEGETPLHEAARRGSTDVAELLINNGVQVNVRENSSGYTPLHYAVIWRHIKMVELLIENGADVNLRDFSGKTPLYTAQNSREEILLLLVRNGGRL